MALMNWGIICSVYDEKLVDYLESFGTWLVDELENHSRQYFMYHNFIKKASFCFHCNPGDKGAVFDVYEKIYQKHTNVIYVIHILPQKNSLEFKWLKDLTINYGIVGQAILLEKALAKFEGCQLSLVLENMNQYILRRFSQILCYKRSENTYRLLIGKNEVLNKNNQRNITANSISNSVEMILHSGNNFLQNNTHLLNECIKGNNETKHCSTNTVIIEGFPPSFNKFQITSLFSTYIFCPTNVFVASNGQAFFDYENKFHAAQAVLYYKRNYQKAANLQDLGIDLSVKLADPLAQKYVDSILKDDKNLELAETTLIKKNSESINKKQVNFTVLKEKNEIIEEESNVVIEKLQNLKTRENIVNDNRDDCKEN